MTLEDLELELARSIAWLFEWRALGHFTFQEDEDRIAELERLIVLYKK